jgi:diguanylate cyclase (GGDEF)-like protein
MTESNLHQDEVLRLAAVRRSGLLDTPAEDRFDRITRLACVALVAPMAGIALVDRYRVWFKSARGFAGRELQRDASVFAQALTNTEPIVIHDLRADPRFATDALVTGDVSARFFASVPLIGPAGHCIGVFCVMDHEPRVISADAIEVMRDLALVAESEIQLSAMSQTQSELANDLDVARRQLLRDSLTQTWNRAGILEILAREQSRARRNRQRLGVAMVDLDHFKNINDSHGHLVGDRVLRTVAERMIDAVRPYDAVGRYGGEEFLVVIVDQDQNVIGSIAERMRHNIARAPISANRKTLSITASIGVANLDSQHTIDLTELVQMADEALYRAKRGGRNRVVVAPGGG